MIVVKLGGEVVAGPNLSAIAGDLAELARAGDPAVIVHGGGPQATRLQQRLGQEPRLIGGRRVTDEAALDVMKMVVAGQVNVDLCAALLAVKARPVGLHGASDCVVEARKRPPRTYGGGTEPIDLGLVGDVTAIGTDLLRLLVSRGYTPVVASVGASRNGEVFNINADVVASGVATALGADGLFLVSDVPGVLRQLGDPSTRIPVLSVSEGRALIAQGTVTRGMIPKLEEAFAALGRGVRRIHIVGGALGPGDLLREAREAGAVGTALVADGPG